MKIIRNKDAEEPEQKQTGSLVEMLRKIACDELISYHAYITACKNIHGNNWMDVKGEFETHAKEELGHYEAILARLWQLGEPVHAVFKAVSESCGYYWDMDMDDPKGACEAAKKAEREAVKAYKELLQLIANTPVEERDFVTQRLAKSHLETEEEHSQDIAHLLSEF